MHEEEIIRKLKRLPNVQPRNDNFKENLSKRLKNTIEAQPLNHTKTKEKQSTELTFFNSTFWFGFLIVLITITVSFVFIYSSNPTSESNSNGGSQATENDNKNEEEEKVATDIEEALILEELGLRINNSENIQVLNESYDISTETYPIFSDTELEIEFILKFYSSNPENRIYENNDIQIYQSENMYTAYLKNKNLYLQIESTKEEETLIDSLKEIDKNIEIISNLEEMKSFENERVSFQYPETLNASAEVDESISFDNSMGETVMNIDYSQPLDVINEEVLRSYGDNSVILLESNGEINEMEYTHKLLVETIGLYVPIYVNSQCEYCVLGGDISPLLAEMLKSFRVNSLMDTYSSDNIVLSIDYPYFAEISESLEQIEIKLYDNVGVVINYSDKIESSDKQETESSSIKIIDGYEFSFEDNREEVILRGYVEQSEVEIIYPALDIFLYDNLIEEMIESIEWNI